MQKIILSRLNYYRKQRSILIKNYMIKDAVKGMHT